MEISAILSDTHSGLVSLLGLFVNITEICQDVWCLTAIFVDVNDVNDGASWKIMACTPSIHLLYKWLDSPVHSRTQFYVLDLNI